MVHLFEGPFKGHITYRIEVEKSPAPGGIRIHNIFVMRREPFYCATTAALELSCLVVDWFGLPRD